MTLAPLTFDFPIMSALSTRPPYLVMEDEDGMILELDEELAARAKSYPLYVREKRMKEDEAERHIALLADIREDLAERRFYGGSHVGGARYQRAPGARFLFDAKVRELRRELAIRRGAWPKQIEAKRLDPARAALRMERLEAVHYLYWVELFQADDEFNCIADEAERTDRIRAWFWRRDDWRRRAADARDPAADPAWSSEAERARVEAFFTEHPDRRAYSDQLDALYLAAARQHGFVPAEGVAP